MNDHTLNILEFPKVKEIIKRHVATPYGREAVSELKPLYNIDHIKREQSRVTQLRAIIENKGIPPFGGIPDIDNHLRRAYPMEAILDPGALLDIAEALRCARDIRKFFKNASQLDVLADLGIDDILELSEDLEPAPELSEAILAKIDPSRRDIGDTLLMVRDNASKELSRLRIERHRIEARIHQRLTSLINALDKDGYLSDNVPTLRDGRYVIPVTSQYKSKVQGIVHDKSSSGATTFIEPKAIVEYGNQLREVQAQEKVEVFKILAALTTEVRVELGPIRLAVDRIATLDSISARARYSINLDMTEPRISEYGIINLMEARHPLLRETMGPEQVVPIDLQLGDEARLMVVTGPNTGGKTVTIKTVGLLTLMALAGMHISAAPGSQVAVFENVFADIGDEQSIEQSLSTFSSHITNIANILKEVNDQTLVLLDELGAGTDPSEGSTLGQAMLETILKKGGLAIVTTHLNQLKHFAANHEKAINAAVEFDIVTLQPTYHLLVGLPGHSNALAIAKRLGLDEAVINRASELIGEPEHDSSVMLRHIQEARSSIAVDRAEARRLKLQLMDARDKYEKRLESLMSKRSKIIESAHAEARAIIQKSQQEIKDVLTKARQLEKEIGTSAIEQKQVRSELKKLEFEQKKIEDLAETAEKKARTVNEPRAPKFDELKVGMMVDVPAMGDSGKIVELIPKRNTVRIAVKGMDLQLPLKEIKPLKEEKAAAQPPRTTAKYERKPAVPLELDIHGKRIHEAMPLLEKYLDDAVLSGVSPVRIIHGVGTGRLRAAVVQMLDEHPNVTNFRPGERGEGGPGATVVSLGD